jgi:hypothetical protein
LQLTAATTVSCRDRSTRNGIDIPPELLPQLLEMCALATSALGRAEGGLGTEPALQDLRASMGL